MPLLTFAPGLDAQRTAAAAPALLLFTLLFALLTLLAPPDAAQRAAADPLVQLLLPPLVPCALALLPMLIAILWLRHARPSPEDLRRGLAFSALGVIAGLAATLAIRLLYGDTLPPFVPREESAAPGMALGVGAGVIEEALFRLGVLPLVFLALHKRCGVWLAAVVACVVTGLAFALSHEFGPGAGAFDAAHFTTRVLIPGVAMSAVAIVIHPAFMVAAHGSAHVVIALAFVAAG